MNNLFAWLMISIMGLAPPAASPPSPLLNMPSGAQVAVIPIEGETNSFTLISVERRVDRALAGGASLIVFELNTPGGEIISAMNLSKYMKTLPVPTIAWVHDQAYSAGALLASACNQIVMSPASVIGDAAPISLLGDMAPTERAKILSPWLAEFRDNARARGDDFVLYHAMCQLDILVYEIRHRQTNLVRYVNQADYQVMVQGVSFEQVGKDIKVVGVDVATPQDIGQWQRVRQVHDGKTLLTLDQSRAHRIGLSAGTVSDLQDLSQVIGAAGMATVRLTWSEKVAGFLTHLWVRAILIVLVSVCGYIELQAPGVSGAGVVALLALVALVGAPYLLGLAEVWHIVLLLVGLLLVVFEIFTAATAGILAAVGALLMFVGMVLSVIPTAGGPSFGPISLPPSTQAMRLLIASATTLGAVFISFAGVYFLTQHMSRIPGLNRLVLSSAKGSPWPLASDTISQSTLAVGDVGQTLTALHPTGQARFADHVNVIDVVSAGSFIDAHCSVTVCEVHGNRIVVART